MPKVAVSVMVMPDPPAKGSSPGERLMAAARGWLEECELYDGTGHAWSCLRKLYNKLAAIKQRTDHQEKLFSLISPTIEKFAQHDSRGVDVRAENLAIVRGDTERTEHE